MSKKPGYQRNYFQKTRLAKVSIDGKYECKLSIATILNFSSYGLRIKIPSKKRDRNYNDKVFQIYKKTRIQTYVTEIAFWKGQLKHSYMDDVKARYPKKMD
eukprot:549569_1